LRRLLPGTRARHVAVRDGIGAVVGRVALMEFSLRLEHLLAVASGDAEPFLRVLPDELSRWDEVTDLLQVKAQTIGFEDLTAQPCVDAVREIVGVYRGRAEAEHVATLDVVESGEAYETSTGLPSRAER
jgi:hypothetical protein